MAILGSGCVSVVSHIDEFDAGPDVKPSDASGEPEVGVMGPCQSGVRWNNSMPPTDRMNPGLPCMGSGCHTQTSKTVLTVAGTIYNFNAQHDENNCYGLDSTMVGAAVALLDENGMEISTRLQMNPAGNFWTNKPVPPSYKVKVISNGREAPMIAAVNDGNCNSCHSPDGIAMAKGRITVAPPN
jgi:hypothetical protein